MFKPFKQLLLSLLLAWGLSAPSHAVLQASDVLSRARTFIKDQSTVNNRQYFTDAVLLQFASDGQREANAQNWLLQSSFTITLIAGQSEYAVPADFMFVNRAWYQVPSGQPWQKLPASSYNDMDARYPGWQSANGGPPLVYFIDQSSQAVYFGVYPAPAASSTGTITVQYLQSVSDLSSTSQTPFNGWLVMQPYVSALSYYVTYRCWLTLEEPDLAKGYLDYWITFLQIMRQGLARQPDFNPPAAGFRGSGSPNGQGGLGN